MGLLVLSWSSLLSPRRHQLFPGGGGGGGGGGGMGWEIVDAFLFLIIEEGRGLYSVFIKFFIFHFFHLFCCSAALMVLLGLFCLGFMSRHSSSPYKCS